MRDSPHASFTSDQSYELIVHHNRRASTARRQRALRKSPRKTTRSLRGSFDDLRSQVDVEVGKQLLVPGPNGLFAAYHLCVWRQPDHIVSVAGKNTGQIPGIVARDKIPSSITDGRF